MAPAAQPLDPGLAAGLRRHSEPSAVIIDSPSCHSAPTCFTRGFDGGKKINGIKIHLAVDKYGFPLAINVSPANTHDSKGIVPVLHQLAGRGFKGTALGDLSYRGKRLAKAGEALGITLQPSAGGHGGTFIPEGIRWVVERSLGWMSRYRRLNTIFERTRSTSSLSSRSPSSRSCPAAWYALSPRKSAPDVYKQTLNVQNGFHSTGFPTEVIVKVRDKLPTLYIRVPNVILEVLSNFSTIF